MSKYKAIGTEVGELVDSKQSQYGDSVGKTGGILRALYPNGIRVDQYDDVLLVARILDKLSRISQRGADGTDKGGESPFRDVAGYGLLGLAKDEPAPVSEAIERRRWKTTDRVFVCVEKRWPDKVKIRYDDDGSEWWHSADYLRRESEVIDD